MIVRLGGEADVEGWRAGARQALKAGCQPGDVRFLTPCMTEELFAAAPSAPRAPIQIGGVPRAFLDLARLVACHSDAGRYDLLYAMLVRLAGDRDLLQRAADDDVRRAEAMAKSVRRDRHKMTAFVRFREVARPDAEPLFVAWFEPEHHIVDLAASFFVERFAGMDWAILTPRGSLHWDRKALSRGPPAIRSDAPADDAREEDWRVYYASIFNPARLKTQAMKREMPVKYWRNLPEAPLIASLTRQALAREQAMVAAEPVQPPVRAAAILSRQEAVDRQRNEGTVAPDGLARVRQEAQACQRCPLYLPATQTVFGEGPPDADLVFVGEQPGDQEDLAGKPFIGPAGRLFDKALAEAGVDRARAYVTNAVKHFKFEPRGKRRIHAKPNAAEITACHVWVGQEIALIRPRLIVALGATALRSLTGRAAPVSAARGKVTPTALGPVFTTVHPSYLLRLPDPAQAEAEYARFVEDLREAGRQAA